LGIRLPISAAAAALAALAGLGASPAALAAYIEGQIGFPGQSAPPMTAYVCEVDTSRIRTIPIAPGQNKFAVEVPAGRYIVFLAPREAGAPNIYGAHTGADHALANVNVTLHTARAEINIDDWYLSDAIAAQLDRIRGIETSSAAEPLAAPRFSEYRAAPYEATTAPKPDFTDNSLSIEERARLQQSLPGVPNFAGSFSLVLSHCGSDCDRLFLFDWRNGKVFEPAGPGEMRGTLPCRAADAVQFRRDSRLLSVTSVNADGLLTRYFLWRPDTGTLTPATEIQRTVQQFCAA
jgi:hypothetical protein